MAVERLEVRVGGDIGGAVNALSRLGRHVERTGARLQETGQKMTRAITVPLAALAALSGRAGMQFDDAFSRIRGLVGLAEKDVAGLRKEVLRLSPAVGRGPQELADALFTITSAGARGRTAMEVLQSSSMAATAGLGETETVARAVTAVLATYSAEGLTSAQATDTLTAAIRAGNLEASSLAGVLGQVVGSAQAAGASFEDVAAAIAVMSRQGIDAARASTSLNGLFELLIRNAPGVDKALKGVGLSAEGLRQQIREEGLLAALHTLNDAFDGNREAMARAIPNSEAMRVVLSILGQDAAVVSGVFRDVRNSTGVLAEAFEAAQTPGQRMRQALAQLQVVGIQLGDSILPALARGANALSRALRAASVAWESLGSNAQRTVLVLATVAAVMGPLLTVVGALVTAIGVSLAAAVTRSAASLIFLISPLGLLSAAIVAAGVAAYLFRDEIADAFENVKTAATAPLQSLQDTLGRWRDNVASVWASVRDGALRLFVEPVVRVLDQVAAFLGRWTRRAVDMLAPFVDWMGFDLRQALDGAAESAQDSMAGIREALGNAFGGKSITEILLPLNAIRSGIASLGPAGSEISARLRAEFERLKAMWQSMVDTFGAPPEFDMEGFEAAMDAALANLDDLDEGGKKSADTLAKAFEGAGDQISRTIGDSVVNSRNLLEGLGNVARNILSNIITGFASAGIGSVFGASGLGLPGFASGGRMQRGLNMINERGAELVYSTGPATVRNASASQHDMRSQGGGLSVHINAPGADEGTLARLTEIAEARIVPQAVQAAKSNTIAALQRRRFA